MKHYTKRAQDKLDLMIVVDTCLARIKSACKGAVAHAAKAKVDRLIAARAEMERALKAAQGRVTGVISWLLTTKQVSSLKKQLAAINHQIVDWLNSVYRYFAFV